MAVTTTPNLTIRQGDTYRATFQKQNATGIAQSLTGTFAVFQLLSRAGGTVLLTVSSQDSNPADGTVQVEPSGMTGFVTVRLTAQQTAALTRNCVFTVDTVSLSDASEIDNVAAGTVTLKKTGAS